MRGLRVPLGRHPLLWIVPIGLGLAAAWLALAQTDRAFERELDGIGDLDDWFRDQQATFLPLFPPSDYPFLQTGWPDVLPFDPRDFPLDCRGGLYGDVEFGVPVYEIFLVEDTGTREFVVYNKYWEEVCSVAAPADYDARAFVRDRMPDLYTGSYTSDEVAFWQYVYDPSRIQISVRLVPDLFYDVYLASKAEAAALSSLSSGGIMMMSSSGGDSNLHVHISMVSTGGHDLAEITVHLPPGFTNGVDLFTCDDLGEAGSTWTLAATNLATTDVSTVVWTNSAMTNRDYRVYTAGDSQADTDGDNLVDAHETLLYGTDPEDADSDDDGLDDDEELSEETDPHDPDCDGDDLLDGDEIEIGADPWNPDTDGDGMPDGWEATYGLDPLSGDPSSLIAWWKLDEGSGTVASNSVPGSYAGILSNMTSAGWVEGKLGSALTFDGADDLVAIPQSTALITNGAFTLSAWVRYPTGVPVEGSWYSIFSDYERATGIEKGYWLGLGRPSGGAGQINFTIGDGEEPEAVQHWYPWTFAKRWIHLAATYDGTAARLCVDGVWSGPVTGAFSAAESENLLLGCFSDGTSMGSRWLGELDDVRIYAAALSSNQVAGMYDALGDPDHDGRTNFEESEHGKDPMVPDCWPAVDVVLVMDCSGSMDTADMGAGMTRLEAAQVAASNFVESLNFTGAVHDLVAVVSFSNAVRTVCTLTNDGSVAIDGLNGLSAQGGTRIDLGIQASQAELTSARRNPLARPMMIVLSDGKNTSGTEDYVELAANAAKYDEHIRLVSVALSTGADTNALYAIASEPKSNNYYYATNAVGLDAVYELIADSICREYPPTIIITNPVNGQEVAIGSELTVTAESQDDDLIYVEILAGETLLTADYDVSDAYFEADWEAAATGSVTFKAVAHDVYGLTGTNSVTITITNAAPSVAITIPMSNQTFASGSAIHVVAEASDKEGAVTQVQFCVGSTANVIATDYDAPFSCVWLGAPLGSNSLIAKAWDAFGLSSDSDPVPISVTDAPPSVVVFLPQNGSSVPAVADVTIGAAASDDLAITQVVLYANGVPVATNTEAVSFATHADLRQSTNLYYAWAWDSGGHSNVSATVTNYVTPRWPTVEVIEPLDGTVFASGEPISITAIAADADGTVATVQIDTNSATFAQAAQTNTVTVVWTNAAVDEHQIRAIAADNDGRCTTSSPPVDIQVEGCDTPATLQDFKLSATSVAGGTTLTGTVRLSANAIAGGQAIRLGCDDQAVMIPGSLLVPENTNELEFAIGTLPVMESESTTVVASFLTTEKTVNLNILGNVESVADSEVGSTTNLQIVGTASTLTATTLASAIIGPGVQLLADTATFTGATCQAGLFVGGGGERGMGFDGGLVLCSGNITNLLGPSNLLCSAGAELGDDTGDGDLYELVGHVIQDVSILEFDVIPSEPLLTWEYVFGSEEYDEYVPANNSSSVYNDVFGFFVTAGGVTHNAAVLDDGRPVAVFNVNAYDNRHLYRDNRTDDIAVSNCPGACLGPAADTEIDGFTKVLEARAYVIPNATNHIKLAIADVGDCWLDSFVMIRGSSLKSLGQVVCTRDDLVFTNHAEIALTASSPVVLGDDASFDLRGIHGGVQAARIERAGEIQFASGNRFDMQYGVQVGSLAPSFGAAQYEQHDATDSWYEVEWWLPSEYCQDAEAALGGEYELPLLSQLSSLCGGSHDVLDLPHGSCPAEKNILTILVETRPEVAPGRCLDFILPGSRAPLNGTWDILLQKRIIASSGRPEGWDVEEDHTAFGGFTVTAPPDAEPGQGYVVRAYRPGSESGNSGVFAVLDVDSSTSAPMLKPLVLSSNMVPGSQNVNMSLTVQLDAPAPVGRAHVTFDASEGVGAAGVPEWICVPYGMTSSTSNFTVNGSVGEQLTLRACYNGYREAVIHVVDACDSPGSPTVTDIANDDGRVLIEWASAGSEITYNISRSNTVSAGYETLFTGLGATNFIDTTPEPSYTNYYRIVAVSNWCESATSVTNIKAVYAAAPPAPWVIPNGGVFHAQATVTLTNRLAGSTNYYALDGSLPYGSTNTFAGSETLTLTSDATIRAVATNANYSQASAIVSAAFSIVQPSELGCGSNVTATLSSACPYSTVRGSGFYSCRFSVECDPGQLVQLAATSAVLDTVVYLFDPSGSNLVAASDNMSTTNDGSRIEFKAAADGTYTLEVTSASSFETGEFGVSRECPVYPDLYVSTSGTLLFQFDLLDLGETNVGDTLSTSLVVSNAGLGTLNLSAVEAFPTNLFSFSPASITNVAPAATTNLTVEFMSTNATEAFGLLVVSNNVPSEDPFYLNLYAVAGAGSVGGPEVAITAPTSGATFAAGTSVTISASASPSDHIEEVQFWRGFLLGSATSHVDGVFSFDWTAEADAETNGLVAVAVDDEGRMAVSEEVPITITVDPGQGPTAGILNPRDGTDTSSGFDSVGLATVREGLLSVTGEVYHVVSNVYWKLELLDAEGTVLRNFTPGDLDGGGFALRVHAAGADDPFELARCDLTSLRNGVYQLNLTVRGNHRVATDSVRFRLESNLKIGQFSFTEQDLVIPVSGMPLSVLRTYDSLNPEKGAFGYGWTYSINDLDVRLYDKRQTATLSDGAPVSLRVGGPRDVTLTLPDGRRTTFTFGWQVGHFVAAPKFYAAPGVRATLETLEGDLYDKVNGRWMTDATAAFDWYEFSGYKLTLEDGARFIIEREKLGRYTATGGMAGQIGAQTYGEPVLTRVEHPGGDRILIGSDAYNAEGEVVFQVAHRNATNETTRVVDFKRNHLGLITEISDPNGRAAGDGAPPAVKYEYDDTGHLVRVLRLTDHAAGSYTTNQYFYENTAYPHYLTRIVDGRGVDVARSLYDDAGRLFAVIDAAGETNEFRHGLDANTNYVGAVNEEVVVDRMGHSTFHGYDARGNVVYTIDAEGEATFRTYDDDDNVLSVTDPSSYTTRYAYDAYGNRMQVVDSVGRTNLFTYNSRGDLLTETDPAGNVTQNRFDSSGNLTNTVHKDAEGTTVAGSSSIYENGRLVATKNLSNDVTATFAYDSAGNLTSVTNADAFARSFVYDLNGNQLGSSYVGTNENDEAATVTTTNLFDAAGRVTHSIDAFGHTNRTTYNAIGKQASTTNRYGHVTTFVYDARGSLIRTAGPLSTNLTVYDANAQPTFTTSRNGVFGTGTEYDAVGRVVRTIRYTNTWVSLSTNASGHISSAVASWGTPLSTNATVYYANGWVKERIGADGAKTTYTYWPDGQTRTVTDALGNRTVYTYDEAGRRESMLDAELRSTWFRYDALGRQAATVFADGSTISNLYNQLGRRVAEIDQAGLRTDFGYNVAGLLTSVTKPEVLEPHGDTNAAPTWVYNYDAQGRLLVVTDPNGHSTTNTFNEFGQQYSHELQMGQVSSKLYYTNGIHAGQLWKEYDFKGQVTEYFYDDFGRATGTFYFAESSSDPAMGVLFNFNGLGQLAKVIETHGIDATETNYPSAFLPPVTGRWRLPWPNVPVVWLLVALFLALAIFLQTLETVLRCRIARLSRALSLVLPGSAGLSEAQRQPHPRPPRRHHHPVLAPHYRFISYALIAALLLADANLQTLWTAHADITPPTNDDETRTTTFTYDFEGRLTQVAAPEGKIHYGYDLTTGRHTSTRTDCTHIEYGHDLLGRLQTVRVLKRNNTAVDETTTYTYTPVGSREAIYYPNGVSTHYQYDSLNRLTKLTHRAADNSLLADYAYTLGDTGRRTAVTEIILEDDDTTYTTNTITWQYDGLYRLTNETFNADSTVYEYDLVGNRLSKTVGTETNTYAYNANDQLTNEVSNVDGTTTYAFDLNGSLTNKTVEGVSTNDYTYNLANRLASATTAAGTTSFLYDYQGIRVRSKGGGSQEHFLVDHRNPTGYAQILEETSSLGADPTRTYIIGDDALGQCGLTTTDTQWLLYDGHGSTRQLLSDAGSVAAQYNYDAYGVSTAPLPSPPDTTLLYAGEQYDPVLEQYYLRARYYNPATGRFNRPDPFAGINHDPQSLHKYAYAHCDPVNNVDPSGEMTLLQLQIGIAVAFTLTGIFVGGAIDGVRGAVAGGLVGAIVGTFVAYMWGAYIFVWASGLWVTVQATFQRFGAPATQYISGPAGRVSLQQLQKVQSTSSVTLFSRLSRAIEYTRTLHTSTSEALASAGARANYMLYQFRVPSGVLTHLESIGAATRSTTTQAGVTATEWVFTAEGAAYISQYVVR